jgi:hypothetical protein
MLSPTVAGILEAIAQVAPSHGSYAGVRPDLSHSDHVINTFLIHSILSSTSDDHLNRLIDLVMSLSVFQSYMSRPYANFEIDEY